MLKHPKNDRKKAFLKNRVILGLLVCSLALSAAGCGTMPKETEQRDEPVKQQNIQTSGKIKKKNRRGLVSGEWEEAVAGDLFEGLYVYELDRPIERCVGLTVDYNVEISVGGPCDDWELYIRSGGEWEQYGTLTLRNGSSSTRLNWESPLTVEAVMAYPLCDGEMEWRDEIFVYEADRAELPEPETIPTEPETLPPETEAVENWVEGAWGDVTYKVNDTQSAAYELKDPIENCRKLKVAMQVEMKYGARCENWTVYTWKGGAWSPIGDLYLPNGDGYGETEITLDNPMTIGSIIIVPKVSGSYSWSCGIAVCDLNG